VLQVRLNPAVDKVKHLIESGVIGNIRGVSLTQRWQRPIEYFSDWRGVPKIGGGTLHECGIHYIDIMCYLFGKPEVHSTKTYNTKHLDVGIEDTIHSLLDFGTFGGILEVTISAEPQNIECSMMILADEGFIRLGGQALNKVVEAKFLKTETTREYEKIMSNVSIGRDTNSYGKYSGSCPNHPELYSRLDEFDISISYDSIKMVDEIYKKCNVTYY
jgi:UDP-N-acetyl-2-amino-2-deoxyglucuronate dehydrogenase